MLNEFKAFIMRGNVMDLAVGVIIGGAFGKIVTSLVNDVLMPFIGVISGGVDFTSLRLKIGGTTTEPLYFAYGSFLQSVLDFLIIALIIFLMVRFMNRLKKPSPIDVATKNCPRCTMTIAKAATRCPHCTSELA